LCSKGKSLLHNEKPGALAATVLETNTVSGRTTVGAAPYDRASIPVKVHKPECIKRVANRVYFRCCQLTIARSSRMEQRAEKGVG